MPGFNGDNTKGQVCYQKCTRRQRLVRTGKACWWMPYHNVDDYDPETLTIKHAQT